MCTKCFKWSEFCHVNSIHKDFALEAMTVINSCYWNPITVVVVCELLVYCILLKIENISHICFVYYGFEHVLLNIIPPRNVKLHMQIVSKRLIKRNYKPTKASFLVKQ